MHLIIGLLIALSGIQTSTSHDFHLSRSTFNYNSEKESIEMTVYLFIDDLEDALKLAGIDSLYICTKKEHLKAERYIESYLHQSISISLDDVIYQPSLLGKEISDDLSAVWCYLEITRVPRFTKIEIYNDLLLELFEDQKNVVTFHKNNQRVEDVLLDKNITKHTISTF